jgi:hypothetical protein
MISCPSEASLDFSVRPDDLIVNRGEGEAWLAENYHLPMVLPQDHRRFLGLIAGAPGHLDLLLFRERAPR